MVLSLLARQRARVPLDAADALAVAICHIHSGERQALSVRREARPALLWRRASHALRLTPYGPGMLASPESSGVKRQA